MAWLTDVLQWRHHCPVQMGDMEGRRGRTSNTHLAYLWWSFCLFLFKKQQHSAAFCHFLHSSMIPTNLRDVFFFCIFPPVRHHMFPLAVFFLPLSMARTVGSWEEGQKRTACNLGLRCAHLSCRAVFIFSTRPANSGDHYGWVCGGGGDC